MDLASLRAISICLFVVVIAALDSTPCHMPRSIQEVWEGCGFRARVPLGILDNSMELCSGARAAIF